jgi:electron transport complex protein RnfB
MPPTPAESLADHLDACLPQTQCRRCGYADCRAYAGAMAAGAAAIDRCPPGGAATRAALQRVLGRAGPPPPLSAEVDTYAPEHVAFIDETRCIGCTQCLPECPTDAIVGAAKRMHTVIAEDCTGCELCLIACPVVDCIRLVPRTTFANRVHPTLEARAGQSGWLRARYAAHQVRWAAREEAGAADAFAPAEAAADDPDRRRALLAEVLARARARVSGEAS